MAVSSSLTGTLLPGYASVYIIKINDNGTFTSLPKKTTVEEIPTDDIYWVVSESSYIWLLSFAETLTPGYAKASRDILSGTVFDRYFALDGFEQLIAYDLRNHPDVSHPSRGERYYELFRVAATLLTIGAAPTINEVAEDQETTIVNSLTSHLILALLEYQQIANHKATDDLVEGFLNSFSAMLFESGA